MIDWIERAGPLLRAVPFGVLLVLERRAGVAAPLRHVARNLAMLGGYVVVTGLVSVGLGDPVRAWASGRGLGLLTPIPEAPRWVVAVLVLDLLGYLLHRLYHRWPVAWRAHRVHHSDPQVDVSTAYRFHPFEVAATSLAGLGVTVALGVPGEAALVYYTVLATWSMVQHTAVPWPPAVDRLLATVLATREVHRVHHARRLPDTDRNFGAVLTAWDHLFGTWRAPAGPVAVGLDGYDDDSRQTVSALYAEPLRRTPPG